MNLDQFLERFTESREEGDGWVAVCPSHSDSHPSLRVAVGNRGQVLLKCRAGCETSAVLKAMNLTFGDLANIDTEGVTVRATSEDVPASEDEVAALAARLEQYGNALRLDGPEPYQYLERRFGLTQDDADRLGLGRADDLGGGPRLVVPFRDKDGVPRGYQARAIQPDATVRWLGAKSPQGASWSKLAWFPGSTGWAEVIITEGPGDALTACGVGYDSIAIRGAALASNQTVVDTIVEWVGDRPVVVFGDNDDSGRKFADTLVGALSRAGVSTVASASPREGDVTEWRENRTETFTREFIDAVGAAIASAPSEIQARLAALSAADLNDLGMARRLLEHIQQDGGVRFTPEAGFYLLNNGVWEQDKLDEVRTLAQQSARALYDEVDELLVLVMDLPDGPEKEQYLSMIGRIAGFARHANNTLGINSMIRELQSLRGVAVDIGDFDTHHDLLACKNGVINLRTGDLLDHNPALLLTRRLDLDYKPDAKCERWDRFLIEVFPDNPDVVPFMQRMVGYGITGHTDEQTFVVHWGTGSNGKSVFIDTLTDVFRSITVTTPFSTFEQKPAGGIPNDLAALNGARLVMASEGEQGKPMAEAVLKRVTGKDYISARFMRREFFEFRPQFLLMLATNAKPNFRGQDEGLWRRVKLIPWKRYFAPSERDHYLEAKLLTEAEGILAWAVRGAVEWFANGLQDPACITGATDEYRQTSDALADFISGHYEMDREASTPGKVLWDDYLNWVEDERLPLKEQWSRKAFFGALEERGYPKKKTKHGVAFTGLRKSTGAESAQAVISKTTTPDAPDLADL